jgi:hypothetical protein
MDVLVGRGRLRQASTALLISPVAGAVIGAACGFALSIGDPEVTPLTGLAFGLVGLAVGSTVSLVMISIWLVSAARVSYYVSGSRIVVRRGRRIVASVDAATVARVEIVGRATTRGFFIGLGGFWSLLSDLPLVATTTDDSRWSILTDALPSILIVGDDELRAFATALSDALLRGGVEPHTLRSLVSSSSDAAAAVSSSCGDDAGRGARRAGPLPRSRPRGAARRRPRRRG